MGKIMLNNIEYSGGGNADVVYLTQAEYDALPSSKLTDNKIYMITDINGDGSQFQPVIYSEDEREIGVWTDGKPLYQKTFELTIPNGGSGAYEHTFTEAAIPNLDKAVKTSYSLGAGERAYVPWYLQATVILDEQTATGVTFYFGSNNYAGRIIYYTVCYTKTTDQAGSGTWTPQGVPAVHYSTDEQVVGTWIDGSTIYRKVVELSESLTIPSNTWTSTGINISGVNTMLKCSAIDSNGTLFDFFAANSNQPIQLLQTRSSQIIATIIILEYTKTL